MTLEDAIRHALDGRAVLFTGAGFSYGATSIEGAAIPSGKALAEELLNRIGYARSDGALDKAAAAYLRRMTKREMVDLLIRRFSVKDVTKNHQTISSLPWRRVYTTNYDTVFEEACKKTGKICTSIQGGDQPKDHLAKPNLLIHINGSIARLTEDALDSSFKLISQSYAADSFEHSGWAYHFRNDIRTAAAVIFIGYSMYDLDVRRVLFSEDISSKCIFIVAPLTPENELDAEDLADLGVVAPIGVDSFADEVEVVKHDYVPQVPELLLEVWEEKLPVKNIPALPSDTEVLDFLISGDLAPALLLEACGPSKNDYVVERTSLASLEADLSEDGVRAVVVGDLGSGKTFLCDTISQVFLSKGWNVFKLRDSSSLEIAELEAICTIPGNKLLIVENYPRHLEVLKWLSEFKAEQISLVLTARTHAHELFSPDLYAMFGEKLRLHDLSKLSDHEIESAVNLFDRYGLWADRSKWNHARKVRFVSHDCSQYLSSLLVDVLKSQHITQRFVDLLSSSSNRTDIEELLVCSFALEIMDFRPKIAYIQELIANRVHWARLRTQDELKTIVDFDSDEVRAKSSVLASYLLGHIFSAKSIVAILVGMTKEAEARKYDRAFGEILHSLMRFSNLSLLLPERDRLASTINFYEGIKNIAAARRNPQFWLQYAIACLAFGKLDRAERYFKDAYSYAPEGYNTFQIDNHYARLLLEKALLAPTTNDVIELVDEARKIVFAQMSSEVRYYPYRVALGLFRCHERFLTSWTREQAAYFSRIFEEVRRRCNATRGSLRNDKYVVECLASAERVLGSQS